MSAASYRITTEHDPAEWSEYMRWQARIVRLTDGDLVKVTFGPTEEDAVQAARAFINLRALETQAGHVYFASEEGDPAEPIDLGDAGHSLKAGA